MAPFRLQAPLSGSRIFQGSGLWRLEAHRASRCAQRILDCFRGFVGRFHASFTVRRAFYSEGLESGLQCIPWRKGGKEGSKYLKVNLFFTACLLCSKLN